MPYSELEKHLSAIRMQRYLNIANQDKKKACLYYEANIKLAQAFVPVLHMFEVGLRNVLNSSMSHHFGESWVTALPDGILGEIGGVTTNLAKEVLSIKERLTKCRKAITADRIISETSFGFWVEIFYRTYDAEIGNAPFHFFLDRKVGYNRVSAYDDLILIKDLRNRVSHHDTIYLTQTSDGDTIGLKKISATRTKMYDVLHQANTEIAQMTKQYDEVPKILTSIALIQNS